MAAVREFFHTLITEFRHVHHDLGWLKNKDHIKRSRSLSFEGLRISVLSTYFQEPTHVESGRHLPLLKGVEHIMTSNKTDQILVPKEGMISRNIHHLPPELLHMICNFLEPMDVAGIRLLDRTTAAVGLEHVVAQIHLIAKPDSFDRLLAVAEHPTAGRYVTSLFYEANLLGSPSSPQNDGEEWQETVAVPDDASLLEEFQDPYFVLACDRLPKRHIRRPLAIASSQHLHYTKRELQQAYEKHRSYHAEQCRMNKSDAYEEALVRAMKRLPHLTSIIVSSRRGLSNSFRAAFRAGLPEDVAPDPGNAKTIGTHQLSLLLSAANKAGLRITKLVCGSLGQIFLDPSFKRYDATKRIIHDLRTLYLFFTHKPEEVDPYARTNPHGSDSFGMWSVDFATSATNLETLSVRYDEDRPFDSPDLKHVVRDFQWSRLTSATLGKMSTRAETLIGFCDRHAATLKDFSLTDIRLRSGRWSSMFCELRQKLELKKMTVAGFLQSVGGHYWILEENEKRNSTKRIIEMYILHADPFDRSLPFDPFVLSCLHMLQGQQPHQPHAAS